MDSSGELDFCCWLRHGIASGLLVENANRKKPVGDDCIDVFSWGYYPMEGGLCIFAFQVDVDLLGAKLVRTLNIFSGFNFKFGREFEIGSSSDVDGIEQSAASCSIRVRVQEERGYMIL